MSLIPAFEIDVWNAWIFMISLLVQTLVIRLLSKEVYRRAGHPSDMKHSHTYKIVSYVSLLTWLLSTVYSVFLPFQLGTIWFAIGLTIFLLGLTMFTVASVNFAVTPMNKPVTKGMYRYTRHPIYIAIFLIYLSVGLASVSWVFLLVSVAWLALMRLTVDDEERYLETTRKLLTRMGYHTETASGGEEALKKLSADPVHVVILDVKMPGMDGHETFREIKKRHPLVEVIMLTGHATVDSAIEGLKQGAFDYVIKPADIEKLAGKVNEAHARFRAHQERIDRAVFEKSTLSPREILKHQ